MTSETSTLSGWKQQLNNVGVQRSVATAKLANYRDELTHVETYLSNLQQVKDLFMEAARKSQDQVSGTISHIVTTALHTVFDASLEFKVAFVERRGGTEADLLLFKNGKDVDPLGNSGLSIANVIAIALRAAFIILNGKVDRFMLLDEPTAAVMVSKQRLVGEMLQVLCKKFKFKILLTTHSVRLAECADTGYFVSMNSKGVATAKLLDYPGQIRDFMEEE